MTIKQQGGVFGRNPTFNSISFAPGSGGNIDSGVYTPVATGIVNCDSVTAYECTWVRIGNVVQVAGRVDVDATASGDTRWSLTLPVPDDLTAIGDLAGICAQRSSSIQYPGTIYAGVSADNAEFRMYATSTSDRETYFNFTYRF
jgi:hypothetical protein